MSDRFTIVYTRGVMIIKQRPNLNIYKDNEMDLRNEEFMHYLDYVCPFLAFNELHKWIG